MNLESLRVDPSAGFTARVLTSVGLVDEYVVLDGPVGRLHVAFNPRGVSFLWAGGDEAAFTAAFARRVGRPLRPAGEVPPLVERALRTGRVPAGLRFDLGGLTPFARAVLERTAEIPTGQVRTYADIARAVGRPAATRAVGNALGANPVPVLIPCHRVVRSDGRVGNYAFGADMKRALLAREGAPVAS